MIDPPKSNKTPNAEPDSEVTGLTPSLPETSGDPPLPAPEKPRIQVVPGNLHVATAETDRLLADTGDYFTRAGTLVRLIERNDNGVATERVHEQTLKLILSRMIDWERRGRDGVGVRCDPDPGVIHALLYGQDHQHIPRLNGLARQPYYGPDGLVAQPGYHVGTGIYGAFQASDYCLDNPSRELAGHSQAYLENLLSEFEFSSDADRSAAISAMLTAVVRPSLSVAPAFSITATSSGSGKSYLADIISLFAGPEEPQRVSYPGSADEAGKLIVSALLESPNVVLFDDMQTNWRSLGPLNRALTSSTTTERLLGSNRTATVPTRVLILGTGNNIEPERDLRRRVVSIRLAPQNETPALRSFQNDPISDVRKNRARAVECALNIIGAYRASGEAVSNVPAIGTYEEWSQLCRYPLIWLGLPDPAQSLIDQVSHDPERQSLAEFLEVWHRFFGSKSVTTRKLIAKAEQEAELMEALEELPVIDGRYVNRGRLGWFISKNQGRRAGGLRIEPGDSSERRSWKVVAG
ncbi:MAG: hypothetical protein K1X67_12290 [Fimbriimonadaceae bacterium]|nr:hypothetical protein [Fimbriimonadaceae bacterium]